jgi:hypothetical protein
VLGFAGQPHFDRATTMSAWGQKQDWGNAQGDVR